MAKLVKTNLDFENTARIVNLLDPVAPQEPATMAYVDGLLQGLAWKDDVRVASAANVNLASPGAAIDGVTLAVSDRVLIRSQTTTSQNGIYIFNGAASAMTRASDASTGASLNQAITTVREGTSAAVTFRQTQINIVLGTDPVLWVTFGAAAAQATETTAGVAEIATQAEVDAGSDDTRFVTPLKLTNWAGRVEKFAATFGDGAATQYDITHNIATDVVVSVSVVSTGAEVICDVAHFSATVVRLNFVAAPALNSLRCVVIG